MTKYRKTVKSGLIVMLVFGCIAGHAGQIYKWQDGTGKWHYTQTPPPANVEVEKMGRAGGEYKKEELQNNKLFPLILYANDCGSGCKESEEFLKRNGLAYTKKDPSKDAKVYEEFKKVSPGGMAPTLLIGEEALIGFTESLWSGKLGDVGYILKSNPDK